jgi:signal transduction histidine kinase
MLVMTITDDGPGADEVETIAGPERVGLGNTRARLETLYGTAYRLELGRAPGRGARVTIEIPMRSQSGRSDVRLTQHDPITKITRTTSEGRSHSEKATVRSPETGR